jgi:uncharacterized protein YcgI (DUF1989 family)
MRRPEAHKRDAEKTVENMNDTETVTIPAGHGRAFTLRAGARAKISLTDGPQVVDAWAFCFPEFDEFVSCEHTRSCLEKLRPAVGDALYSNRRIPLLTVIEDSSPGIHDLLLSACDARRYALLGHKGPHRSCANNLREALAEAGHEAPELPSPVNLFENVSIATDGTLRIEPPVAKKGDAVALQAERDLVLVLSCCPMDIVPTNGADLAPKPVSVSIILPRD